MVPCSPPYTDGLVEASGVDLEDIAAALADCLAQSRTPCGGDGAFGGRHSTRSGFDAAARRGPQPSVIASSAADTACRGVWLPVAAIRASWPLPSAEAWSCSAARARMRTGCGWS